MVSGSDQLKFMCTPKWSPENIDDMLGDCSLVVFERLEGAGAVDDQEVLKAVEATPHIQKYLNNKIYYVQ